MPGTRCTVAVCNNSFEKTKRAGIKIIYHQFPKAQPIRNIWIESCGRAGTWNPNSCHVCSIHFKEDDYKQDTSEYSSTSGKKRLRPTAIPSLFLTEAPPNNITSQVQRKRRKISLNDKPAYSNEDNIMYSTTHDSSDIDTLNNSSPMYEFCIVEDLKEDQAFSMPISQNDDLVNIDLQKLQNYYINRHKENKKLEIKDIPYYPSKNQCIILRDSATQTKPDYFLENYQSLVDQNQKLKSKLIKLNIKYEKLLLNMKFLESKLRNLSFNAYVQEL